VPFEDLALGGNYLYLCGNAFGNVIQLEPQPSIPKAAELEYKIYTVWYKPIAIEEI
jgi:hypothetical protein